MNKPVIKQANKSDIETITAYIEQFGLDDENILPEQFSVLKVGKSIAGFGRIKCRNNLYELCSLGVVEEFRGNNYGKFIVWHLLGRFEKHELWLTTKSPEYFVKFGFCRCYTPPDEIKNKQQRLCAKLNTNINETKCMIFKKTCFNQMKVIHKAAPALRQELL